MKNSLWLLILCLNINACAQVKTSVKGGKAYFFERIPGMVQRDLDGNEKPANRDTVTTVYIEVKGSQPTWTTAWKSTSSYSINATAIKQKNMVVGTRMHDGKTIQLSPSKGYTLWRLELTETNYSKSPKPLKNNTILLKADLKGKPFYYTITEIIELASPEYM